MKGKTPWLIAGGAVVLVLILAGAYAMLNPPQPAPKPARVASVAPQTVTPTAPPAPAIPFSYESRDNDVDVTLKLPNALADAPELHARLYSAGMTELRKYEKSQAKQTIDPDVPYVHAITWTMAAQTDKLISLEDQTYDFSGGAHGNTDLQGLLYDRSTKAPIKGQALFKSGAAQARLDALLCHAIADAKKSREGDAFDPGDTSWPCPKWSESSFVLAASNQPGKAGGVTFLFSPYALASYAEGPYEITVPQSAFHDQLAPAYADEFAGKPPRVGDVTPLQK